MKAKKGSPKSTLDMLGTLYFLHITAEKTVGMVTRIPFI